MLDCSDFLSVNKHSVILKQKMNPIGTQTVLPAVVFRRHCVYFSRHHASNETMGATPELYCWWWGFFRVSSLSLSLDQGV